MREAFTEAVFTSSPYALALSLARDRLRSPPALSRSTFLSSRQQQQREGPPFPHSLPHPFFCALHISGIHANSHSNKKQSVLLAGKF